MTEAWLVFGLGNPGEKYRLTRHNAGFLAVDRFGKGRGAEWKRENKLKGDLAWVTVDGRRIGLCKPLTYMNNSGEAVQAVSQYFKGDLGRLLVVVDDANLPFGQIRLRGSGSSGGHHGLESIEGRLGSQKFARLKIGIGRQAGAREISGYVLDRFGDDERESLEQVLERVSDQILAWIREGLEVAMNRYNGVVAAPSREE